MKIFYLSLIVLFVMCFSISCRSRWDPASRLSGSEKSAWLIFYNGVQTLQNKGDRKKAAEYFREVADKYSSSDYGSDSKELADLLDIMVKEDAVWQEPVAIEKLNLQEKIAYNIYHLRNVNCYQRMQPGMCCLLKESKRKDAPYNAAIELKKIGRPAIPALIELLKDRRPTRSVAYWRNFVPKRTILRYQDAARQILPSLIPKSFYRKTAPFTYLSMATSDEQKAVYEQWKEWYAKNGHKSNAKLQWEAYAGFTSPRKRLRLLSMLIKEPGQKAKVKEKLHELANKLDPVYLPLISAKLIAMGDLSLVPKVSEAFFAGKYDNHSSKRFAEMISAQLHAPRQIIIYGDEKDFDRIKKLFQQQDKSSQQRKKILLTRINHIVRWESLRKNYNKKEFPIYAFIGVLNDKEFYNKENHNRSIIDVRRCDAAANAIQFFSEVDFGFDISDSNNNKDEAIEKIKSWGKEQGKR